MKTLVIIPARYASTRFPGKPLAMLGNMPIIRHVWERVSHAEGVDAVYVATDDERIASCVDGFAGKGTAVMTSADHQSGTDRCGEVVRMLENKGFKYDIVVNLQGDEPFVSAGDVKALVSCFDSPEVQIATLRKRISDGADLFSPNCVKVVATAAGRAMYFSRQPIPYRRDVAEADWLAQGAYYKHIGMYAFRTDVLLELCQLPQSSLEKSEKLEQLRWLEAGYQIAVGDTDYDGVGIDTHADLERAEAKLISVTN